jgi:tRNA(Ile)-lysidine synthase TilS/MesJ
MIKCSREIIDKAVQINGAHQYILLCSAGVDSIAGVHYLLSRVKQHDLVKYKVYHYNHKLRKQNDLMESCVNAFMRSEFPDVIHSCISRNTDSPYDTSVATEADLRTKRIQELTQFFHKNVVIKFHHLNDCVESFLLNCFRGHEGYQPIPFWTEWYGDTKNVLCHPFLFTKKKDLIDYCEKYDLMKYVVEDETNSVSKGSRRNMIPNELIPILDRDKVGLETIVAKKMKQRLMLDLLK